MKHRLNENRDVSSQIDMMCNEYSRRRFSLQEGLQAASDNISPHNAIRRQSRNWKKKSSRSTLGVEVPFVSDPLLEIVDAGSISSRSLPDVPSPYVRRTPPPRCPSFSELEGRERRSSA